MKGLAAVLVTLLLAMSLPWAPSVRGPGPPAAVQQEEAGDRFLISLYQNRLSIHDGARCLFVPTCSEFFREAADRYGLFWGIVMTLERLLYREHRWSLNRYPLSEDGRRHVDPVFENFILDAESYGRLR